MLGPYLRIKAPCLIAGLAILALGFSAATSAATFSFTCITNNLGSDCAIGEAAFQVEITDSLSGIGFVDFTFTRSGTDAANLSEVYFDDGTLLGLSSVASSAEVVFSGGSASPGDLPGGNSIDPVFEVTAGFLAEASNPAAQKGVNDSDDWLTITFELINGFTVADTIAAMGTDLRIGIHVTAFASGGSESLVAPPSVPIPAAGWLLGSALGLLGWMRRRSA
jgi:hypothetical protein